jgi:hypothetical protein
MPKIKSNDYLYIYTGVEYMFKTVQNNTLYLTNPSKWPDRNDAKQLEAYRKEHGCSAVRVLCLSKNRDSLFHWNAIKEKPENRCFIQFYRPELLASLKNHKDIQFKKVQYQKIVEAQREVKSKPLSIEKLPFLKRHPYRVESEWRIVWLGNSQDKLKEIEISPKAISGVTISQDMKDSDFDSCKTQLIDCGLKSKQIHHSTLNGNENFLKCFGL